jgi:hypothetical protein
MPSLTLLDRQRGMGMDICIYRAHKDEHSHHGKNNVRGKEPLEDDRHKEPRDLNQP